MALISKALRNSARGQRCTLRLSGICCDTPSHETTVLCHLPVGMKGIGIKSPDYMAVFGCHTCHNAIDGRSRGEYSEKDLLRAYAETMGIWVKLGLVTIKGATQ